MKESQHIEWKETWRDDCLKWICGFANAEGGVLVIGRNDKGVAVGLTNAAPVKTLGITPVKTPVTPPVTPPVEVLVRLLGQAGALGNAQIRAHMGLKDRAHLRERYLDPALAEGLIEPTIPDKLNSRLQQYRLTTKGADVLAALLKRTNS
jgi:predicted HTH transcriptional regulator